MFLENQIGILDGLIMSKQYLVEIHEKFGGDPCLTQDGLESESCVVLTCPVDGNWGPWSKWSYCNVTCGKGLVMDRLNKFGFAVPLHEEPMRN